VAPRTLADPYPDLGLQAVREHLGVVLYARGGYPQAIEGSAFVPLEPALPLPFDLAVLEGPKRASTAALISVARRLHDAQAAGPSTSAAPPG
jgi:hypothetical protein